MKKLLFLPALLFFFTCGAQQIPVDSFYTQGANWTEYYYVNGGQGSGGIYGRKYILGGDSLISGNSYHLLYRERIGSCTIAWQGSPTPQTCGIDTSDFHYKLIGGLRVDAQKVYCYITDSIAISPFSLPIRTDFLLYDFGPHSVGDTLAGYTQGITSIDSVPFANNTKLARYNIFYSGNFYENYEVYGIGSRSGLFNIVTTPTPYSQHSLCYSSSAGQYTFADSVLPQGLDTNCFTISSTGVNKVNQEEFSISPNPASSDFIHIQCTNKEDISYVSVYDITGRTHYYKNKPFAATSNTLLYIPLEKGIYFIQMRYRDNSSIIQKLVRL